MEDLKVGKKKNTSELFRQLYGDAAYHEMNKAKRGKSLRKMSSMVFEDGKHKRKKHKNDWLDDYDDGDYDDGDWEG